MFCVELQKSLLKMEKVNPFFLFPAAWNVDIMARALAATLGHEVTWRMVEQEEGSWISDDTVEPL